MKEICEETIAGKPARKMRINMSALRWGNMVFEDKTTSGDNALLLYKTS
jgi:hypothetical protein